MKIIITTSNIKTDNWLSLCIRKCKQYGEYPIDRILTPDRKEETNIEGNHMGINTTTCGTKPGREQCKRLYPGVNTTTYEHNYLLEQCIQDSDVPLILIHSDSILTDSILEMIEGSKESFAINSNFIFIKRFEDVQNLAFIKAGTDVLPRKFPCRRNSRKDPFIHISSAANRMYKPDTIMKHEKLVDFYGRGKVKRAIKES